MSTDTRVARRYARALGEVALEQDQLQEVVDQLRGLVEATSQVPEFKSAILDPGVPPSRKRAMLLEAAGDANPLLLRFLELLADKRRIDELDAIFISVKQFADEVAGRVDVRVQSAVPLEQEQLTVLGEALSSATGKEPHIEAEVRPALLGGAVIRVGDLIVDGSIAGRLERLARRLQGGRLAG